MERKVCGKIKCYSIMRLWLQDSLEGTNVAKLHFYALRAFKKVSIDLAGISGYNGSKVIYLLGMAFAFPIVQKEVMADGYGNKKCGWRNKPGCPI